MARKSVTPVICEPAAAGRVCARCGLWKPATEFQRDNNSSSGLFGYCRSCSVEYSRQWRQANPDKMSEYVKRNRARYPQREHLYRRARLKKLGLTPETYDALLAAQGGVCAICHRRPSRRRLSVDHNHNTGKVRGLLCAQCNHAIGLLAEDVGRLASAIAYLEAHR